MSEPQLVDGPGGESVFLGHLFSRLDQSGQTWAVMRNYEALPATAAGSDLDLITLEAGGVGASSATLQAVGDCGAVVVGRSRSLSFEKFFVLGCAPEGGYWGLRIDWNFGLSHRGARVLAADRAGALSLHRGIPVLRPGVAAVLGVLKEVLNNGTMPTRYLSLARTAAQEDWGFIAKLLAPMGRLALGELHHALTSGIEGDCAALSTRLRRAITWQAVRSDGFGYLWRRIRFEGSKFRRFLAPSGAVIAILGVDGVGKSTVIQGVLPALLQATHGACRVRHLRPGFLPPLARLKGVAAMDAPRAGPVLDPHASAPSGWVGSLLRIGWALADYVLGYWIQTRPFIARQPGIVLFDRYAYDMGIDPRRFRIGLPARMTAWLARLAPRPDLVLCLHAHADVILARKQELPRAEVERQLAALRDFAASQPNAVLVSTEGNPLDVRARVLDVLIDFFRHRDKKRHVRPVAKQ